VEFQNGKFPKWENEFGAEVPRRRQAQERSSFPGRGVRRAVRDREGRKNFLILKITCAFPSRSRHQPRAFNRACENAAVRIKCSAADFSAARDLRADSIVASTSALKRKNIRLPFTDYRGRRIYFVTLCFHNRRRFGANPRLARWLIGKLQKHAATCQFFVHAYCVMPDHMHVLAAAASDTSNLMRFVESFKQESAVEFSRRTDRILWQFKYYDHILRGRDSADRVAWYIWQNPLRQGLCRAPTDYPFLGSFTEVGSTVLKSSVAHQWTPPWKSAALKSAALH